MQQILPIYKQPSQFNKKLYMTSKTHLLSIQNNNQKMKSQITLLIIYQFCPMPLPTHTIHLFFSTLSSKTSSCNYSCIKQPFPCAKTLIQLQQPSNSFNHHTITPTILDVHRRIIGTYRIRIPVLVLKKVGLVTTGSISRWWSTRWIIAFLSNVIVLETPSDRA